MANIEIDREWLVKRATEHNEIIQREHKLGGKGSVSLAAQSLGAINMITEIFEKAK